MFYYFVLVTSCFSLYFLETWFICKNKTDGGGWYWLALLFCWDPLWVFLSKHSKNLMFDGMIYDVMIFSGCAISAAYFTGKMGTLTISQWVGFAMIIVGLCLVKYEW